MDLDAIKRRLANEVNLDATIRALRAGQRIFGNYSLEKWLGRGGMGVVWQARDERLGLSVALKFLPEIVIADATGIDQLIHETRRSIELTHPNIVRIHGFREEGHYAAIVMELIEGKTLSERRKAEAAKVFTPAQLLPWVEQLCAALDYGHGERTVHRDLKPANLMLTRSSSRLKVMDFGISATLSETTTRLSRVASNSGTPPYMSPQQMNGRRPGVADDVYSLGATLYELLTGMPPFLRGNIYQQALNVVPPSVSERRAELLAEWIEMGAVNAAAVADLPTISAEWDETVAACLAKDAANRPKSAGEVYRRLSVAATSPSPTSVPPPTPSLPKLVRDGQRHMAVAPLEKRSGPIEGKAWMVPELRMELMPIAAGSFVMGSPEAENGRSADEGPQTTVRLTRPYWLGKYAVTQVEWEAVMGDNLSEFRTAGERAPVEDVSYDDALAFCRELTEKERAAGRLPKEYAYTLPTEAQWEYACRAGTTGAYGGTGKLDDMGWYDANSGETTHEVGQKRANAWGLYDMHGNVWEWCLDWYANKLPGGSVTNPTGASSGTHRVRRGGGWWSAAAHCRSAYRSKLKPHVSDSVLGFRVALSSSP